MRTVLSLCLSVSLASASLSATAGGASGCTPLTSGQHPIRYDISFEGDIRPMLENQCSTCHINGSNGGLNFNFNNAVSQLLGADERGQPSLGDPGILRVRLFEPLASSLFLKINCKVPPFGDSMPLGGTADEQLQAAVYDWIAGGALMPDSPGGERLFVGRFESIERP